MAIELTEEQELDLQGALNIAMGEYHQQNVGKPDYHFIEKREEFEALGRQNIRIAQVLGSKGMNVPICQPGDGTSLNPWVEGSKLAGSFTAQMILAGHADELAAELQGTPMYAPLVDYQPQDVPLDQQNREIVSALVAAGITVPRHRPTDDLNPFSKGSPTYSLTTQMTLTKRCAKPGHCLQNIVEGVAPVVAGPNPWATGSWDPSRQAQIRQANPQIAAQLEQQAATFNRQSAQKQLDQVREQRKNSPNPGLSSAAYMASMNASYRPGPSQ